MAMLTHTHDGRVAHLILDRPPVNVIDLEYARELAAALESLPARAGTALLLVEARGKAFCAGVDVRDHLPDRGAEMLAAFHHVCLHLLECPLPVVAAVQGAALGGGCELTLACDIVVADSHATFGQPEIKLGVFPPLASVTLPHMVPPHVASEMLLTGRVLGAEEAHRAGLVNRVAETDRLADAVELLIGEILALSPASLRLAKRAMALARHRPTRDAIAEAERLYVEHLMHSHDALEGLHAFMEKRAPAWSRE
jgi:cyclohexa-1,5-dienecarbonyl-CoA hydratase